VKYYSAGGLSLGENTTTSASGISYLTSDGLGSVSEALNQTGTATGSILYGPYGGVRYSNGTMPTAKGFTGQYADASTGLDYYGARYYDPALGQFTSADTVSDGASGLNRYGYVKGNPETFTDPSGHRLYNGDNGDVAPHKSPRPQGERNNRTREPVKEPLCSILCRSLRLYFPDARTQAVLTYLMQSPLGALFVAFFMYAAQSMTPGYYIRWDDNHPGQAYTNWDGSIQISPSMLPYNQDYDGDYTPGDLFNAATALVHEGVESFFALAYNVRSKASQHLDYVADYFAGKVASQLDPKDPTSWGSYGLTFADWDRIAGPNYTSQGEPVDQPEVTDRVGSIWPRLASIGSAPYPNGMGLSPGMLTAATLGTEECTTCR
jgi:RHS repeat-associated protein